jgi:hypothetical protein
VHLSFDLPASLERDIERYARAEHLSPNELLSKPQATRKKPSHSCSSISARYNER